MYIAPCSAVHVLEFHGERHMCAVTDWNETVVTLAFISPLRCPEFIEMDGITHRCVFTYTHARIDNRTGTVIELVPALN